MLVGAVFRKKIPILWLVLVSSGAYLLLPLISASVVEKSSAEQQQQQQEAVAAGTCEAEGTAEEGSTCQEGAVNNNNSSEEDDGHAADADVAMVDIPPLPEVSADGYVYVTYGVPQKVQGPQAQETWQRLQEIQKYMYGKVLNKDNPDRILQAVSKECQLRNGDCAFWATIGECDANPNYMKVECAPACYTCDHLSFESRCPLDLDNLNKQNIWKQPGDLHRMFEDIVQRYYPETSHVLLKPGMKNKTYKDSPWVVYVDDFLSEQECEKLIQLGTDRGYERSKDVGAQKFDGTFDSNVSMGRTSTNTWCLDACFEDDTTQIVLEKIEKLTGIPQENSEYLQLLNYDIGQFYEQHHDYIQFHNQRKEGVRIITVFLYLNDVEEGGGTDFPDLGVTVQPKRGRALIWPSVKDEASLERKDFRTEHQALPVTQGIKYAANAWLHMRDFRAPFAAGCS